MKFGIIKKGAFGTPFLQLTDYCCVIVLNPPNLPKKDSLAD